MKRILLLLGILFCSFNMKEQKKLHQDIAKDGEKF